MSKGGIAEIRECIRSQRYVVSAHAYEELEDDELNIYDLENIILTGEIVEHQRDPKTRELKYIIHGFSLGGLKAEVAVKFGYDLLSRLFVITVYLYR